MEADGEGKNPGQESLSNTFSMHQKLNASSKDSNSTARSQPQRPQESVQMSRGTRCLEIYVLERNETHVRQSST